MGLPFESNTPSPPATSVSSALTWKPGQNSALDQRDITRGRDVGTVTVTKKNDTSGETEDVTFAFVYHAFMPDHPIITE
jgi:hypothetical protein